MLGQNQKFGQNHGQSTPQFPSRLKNSDRATLKTENFGPKWFEWKANIFKLYPLSLKFASFFY